MDDRQEYARRADALKQRLWRTALCYLSDEQAALEAVDSAVYKGLLAVHNLRQPEYFNTWLTRILINGMQGGAAPPGQAASAGAAGPPCRRPAGTGQSAPAAGCGRFEPKTAGGGGAALFLRGNAGKKPPDAWGCPGHRSHPAAAGAGAASAGTGRFKRRGGLKDGADTTGSRGIRAVDAAAGNAARRAGVYGAAGTAPAKARPLRLAGRWLAGAMSFCAAFVILVNVSMPLCSRLRAAAFLKELAKAVCLSPSLAAAVENEYAAGGTERAGERPDPSVEYLIVDQKQVNLFYTLSGEGYGTVQGDPSVSGADGKCFRRTFLSGGGWKRIRPHCAGVRWILPRRMCPVFCALRCRPKPGGTPGGSIGHGTGGTGRSIGGRRSRAAAGRPGDPDRDLAV